MVRTRNEKITTATSKTRRLKKDRDSDEESIGSDDTETEEEIDSDYVPKTKKNKKSDKKKKVVEEEEEEIEGDYEQDCEIEGKDYNLRNGKIICDKENGEILGSLDENGDPVWNSEKR